MRTSLTSTTVAELFETQARRTPTAVAIEAGGQTVDYRTLDSAADRWSHRLRHCGVAEEVPVGVCMERSSEFIAMLLAIVKAGGFYVPIDPAWPIARVRRLLDDAGVQRVVADRPRAGAFRRLVPLVLCPGDDADASHAAAGPCARSTRPDHLVYVTYTSGSTGSPKGVAVPHRAVVRLVIGADYVRLDADERVLQFAPASFDASTFEIWGALLTGARLIVPPPGLLSFADLGRVIREGRVTTMWLTAGLFEQMVDRQIEDLCGVRQVVVGGDVVPVAAVRRLRRRYPEILVVNGYGPTENTTFSCCYPLPPQADLGDRLPIGRPVAHSTAYVVDEDGRLAAAGTEGELYVGGAGVARGYYRHGALTAERFVADWLGGPPGGRLYRTGDRVHVQADGTLEFVGRADDQAKIRGFRIELAEIESALRRLPDVRAACAVVSGDGPSDRHVVAFAVADAGSADSIRAAVAAELPEPMVPRRLLIMDRLPLTPAGKVDRAALASRLKAGGHPGEEPRHPEAETATERTVLALWRRALDGQPLGPDDDFWIVGGDSLAAMKIAADLRQRFAVELPLDAIVRGGTVRSVAAEIDRRRQRQAEESAVSPSPESGATLSCAQERVLFLDRTDPTHRAYTFHARIDFEGPLDVQALAAGLAAVLRRHAIYRTRFGSDRSGAVTTFIDNALEPLPFALKEVGEEDDPEARVQSLIAEEVARPFDVARLPLVRWTVYRLTSRHHVLLHCEHHLVHDGWSFSLLIGELMERYRALVQGDAPRVAPAEASFVDFARWERAWLDTPDAAADLDYWRGQLAGVPASIGLPTDHERPATHGFVGRALRTYIDESLRWRVKRAALRAGVSEFAVMLSAFALLMRRCADDSELCVGVAVANRAAAEWHGILGMFVNTIALRLRLSQSPSIGALLRHVWSVALDGYTHQRCPWDRVVEALKTTRDASHNPVFQIAFSMHDTPIANVAIPGLRAIVHEGLDNGTAKFDLNVTVIPPVASPGSVVRAGAAGAVAVNWEYSTELFEPASVARWSAYFLRLLGSISDADADRDVRQLSMMDAAERRHLLDVVGRTIGEPIDAETVPSAFERCVVAMPDAVAITDRNGQVTYGALNDRANRLASVLRQRGVRVERRVLVCTERSADFVIAMLAVLKAGGTYVPLDPEDPIARVRHVAADCGAVVVVVSDEGAVARLRPIEAVLVHAATGSSSAAADSCSSNPDRLAYLIYTSGTSGGPKGVMVPHRGVLNLVAWHRRTYGVGAGTRATHLASAAFDAAVWEIWPYLLSGGQVAIADSETRHDVDRLWPWLRRHQIEIAFAPTPVAERLLRDPDGGAPALRYLLVGGDRLRGGLPRARDYALVNHYGPTESSVVSTAGRGDVGTAANPSIGRPIDNLHAHVLDTALEPVPIGVRGELYVGGEGLARGYAGRPALTAARFVADATSGRRGERLYRAGDIVRWRADGELEFIGRDDQQVKIRGFRIELREIEEALMRHPAVTQAAVVTAANGGEPRLVAYVTAPPERPPIRALRDHVAALLPKYMVPRDFVYIDALPLLPHGKLDRAALAARPVDSKPADADAPARTDLERAIAAMWADVLRGGTFGVRTDFFDAGGHSLLAMSVISRIRDAYEVDLPVSCFLDGGTIEALAAAVESLIVADIEHLPEDEAARRADEA